MEQQPNMMEKGKMKKGKMEMPMTGGPSLGLLLLPAPALLVLIHRIAERGCSRKPEASGDADSRQLACAVVRLSLYAWLARVAAVRVS
jgi:hypothetical protein